MLQQVFELGKLRVVIVINVFPLQPHLVQQLLVSTKHVNVFRFKVITLKDCILGVRLCLLV